MKGLVIREPWIDLILAGEKTWETRSRATSVRGTVGLIRKGAGLVCGVAELIGSAAPLDPWQLAGIVERHRIAAEQFDAVVKARWLAP